MSWGLEFFSASGSATAAGLFVPVANMTGVLSSEMGAANVERKVALGLADQIFTLLNAISAKLGIAVTHPTAQGVSGNTVNYSYTLVAQYMVNHANASVGVLPLPSGNAGLLTLEQILGDGVELVAASGAVPSAGVVIPNTLITGLGGSVPANVDAADARSWLIAFYHGMINGMDTANAAVIAATAGQITGITAPTGTGVLTAELPLRSFFSKTFTLTLQVLISLTGPSDVAA